MSTCIVSGRFDAADITDYAVRQLLDSGIAAGQLRQVHIQQAPELGEPRHAQAVAEEDLQRGTFKGAAAGGVLGLAAGAAALPVIGPAALLAGPAIGAYGGALAGTLQRMEQQLDNEQQPVGEQLDQQLGLQQHVVAIECGEQDASDIAARLRQLGAHDIRLCPAASSNALQQWHPQDGSPFSDARDEPFRP